MERPVIHRHGRQGQLVMLNLLGADRHDVMISYCRANEKAAQKVFAFLKARGFRCWIDKSLSPGEQFDPAIQKAIKRSTFVLVLVSNESLKSSYVRMEVTTARNYSRTIVPVFLEKLRLDDEPFNLIRGCAYEYLDAADDKNLEELARALSEQIASIRRRKRISSAILAVSLILIGASIACYPRLAATWRMNSPRRTHMELPYKVVSSEASFEGLLKDFSPAQAVLLDPTQIHVGGDGAEQSSGFSYVSYYFSSQKHVLSGEALIEIEYASRPEDRTFVVLVPERWSKAHPFWVLSGDSARQRLEGSERRVISIPNVASDFTNDRIGDAFHVAVMVIRSKSRRPESLFHLTLTTLPGTSR